LEAVRSRCQLPSNERRSHLPFFSSDVGLLENLSGSWREMGEAARHFGMGSWIVMPAHHPAAHRFGAFYAANNHLPSENGEEPLRKNRLIFQLLAAELLNWYARQEKALALKNSGLTTLDLQILNAIARGEPLESIAEGQGISLYALRQKRHTVRHFVCHFGGLQHPLVWMLVSAASSCA
jgi:Autoinducer binding domain